MNQRYRETEKIARSLRDHRKAHQVKQVLTLVPCLFAVARGYEDTNDAVNLAPDPAFKIMAGWTPETSLV